MSMKHPQNLPPLKLPLFISFEGGEGAGKTTLMQSLSTYLEENGYSVIVTYEPGGCRLGDAIRQLVLHREKQLLIGRKAELLLFLAARAQHVEEVIAPALLENKIILSDRFSDSSVAYQGFARKLGMEEVEALSLFATGGIIPDLTFFIDIDPNVGLERTSRAVKIPASAGQPDRIESQKKEFHQLVRTAFLTIGKKDPGRIKILDGSQSKEHVYDAALNHLLKFTQPR